MSPERHKRRKQRSITTLFFGALGFAWSVFTILAAHSVRGEYNQSPDCFWRPGSLEGLSIAGAVFAILGLRRAFRHEMQFSIKSIRTWGVILSALTIVMTVWTLRVVIPGPPKPVG